MLHTCGSISKTKIWKDAIGIECNLKNVLCSAEKSSVIWAEPHSRSSAELFGRTERSVGHYRTAIIDSMAIFNEKNHFKCIFGLNLKKKEYTYNTKFLHHMDVNFGSFFLCAKICLVCHDSPCEYQTLYHLFDYVKWINQ